MSNNFDSFSYLPEPLQLEAIREGEARMQAQLLVATAADQRALTWGGLLVAAATGALGGGLTLISKSEPDYCLGLLAIAFSFSMVVAAWKALQTVQPKEFCLPGNRPANWLPEQWDCVGSERRKLSQGRREQAEHLSNQITDNAEYAKERAIQMRSSFQIAKYTLYFSIGISLIVILLRVFYPEWETSALPSTLPAMK